MTCVKRDHSGFIINVEFFFAWIDSPLCTMAKVSRERNDHRPSYDNFFVLGNRFIELYYEVHI